MKSTLTILSFLITSVNLLGHYRDSTSWIVKINAPALGDVLTFPTVSLSLEKRLTQHFSLSSEAGYQFYGARTFDTTFIKAKGYKVDIEARYYFSSLFRRDIVYSKRRFSGAYAALQVFHRNNQYTSGIDYFYLDYSTHEYDYTKHFTDCFGVKKSVTGANIKLGIQKCKGRFVVDIYFGLGILNRQIKNSDRKDNVAVGYNERAQKEGLGVEKTDRSESSGVKPNATLGIRFGCRLSK